MAFIVLDVEIVFLYPFAVVFRGLGAFGLLAMAIFVLTLLVPFAYLLSVGALDWGPVKDVLQRMPGPSAAHGLGGLRPERDIERRRRRTRRRRGGLMGLDQIPHNFVNRAVWKTSCVGAGATPCSPPRSGSRVARSR